MSAGGAAARQGVAASRLAEVEARIAAACRRAGRNPSEVRLVGVTKTVPVEVVREALDAGLRRLGESRIQEAVPKMLALADRAPTWHLVGHLQTNKSHRAVDLFDVIESVDTVKLATELEQAAEENGRRLDVLVQVNLAGETTKHGAMADDVARLVDAVDALPSLTVVGLMAIPPRRDAAEDARADFAALRQLHESLRRGRPALVDLSMGMSDDFEIAVEEGATEVRVGTALFGSR